MEPQNFLDQYEAKFAASQTSDSGFNPNLAKPKETEDFSEFSNDVTLGVVEPKPTIDVGSLLRGIDTDTDKGVVRNNDGTYSWEKDSSDDERYCVEGFLSGRIKLDDISDDDAPFLVAAISHSLFGNKSDYDGSILTQSLSTWNKSKSEWSEGYNPETKTWNPRVVLGNFKKSWEYICEQSAEKKNAMLNADAIAQGWVKDGEKPFFTSDESDEQLDYMYGIAKSRIGSMEKTDIWDRAVAASAGTGKGIDTSLIGGRGWKDPALLGVRDILENTGAAVSRGLSTAFSAITGDKVGMVENGILFHNAGQDGMADDFILHRAEEELGVKSGDYANLVKRIYDNDESHSVKLRNGTVLHVSEQNKEGTGKDYIWIESGNSVSEKMATIDLFIEQQVNTLATVRMSHAIGLLLGNKAACEGVAIYMAGRKDASTFFGNSGDKDGLRTWANNYLDGAKTKEEQAKRFHDVQTAFDAIGGMSQLEGFFGTTASGRVAAAVGNLGVRFVDKVCDMGVGAWNQGSHYVERGLARLSGETDEEAIVSHRKHMTEQQIRALSGANWNGEGSVLEFAGDQILGFKAFELVFAARASALLRPASKIPAVGKSVEFLTKSRKAEVAGKMTRAEKLGAEIDDICDGLVSGKDLGNSTYQQLQTAFRDMAKLRAAKESQMLQVKELCGDAMRAAKIKDACVKVLNNTPNFYTIYASSVDDMEKDDAVRLADAMDEKGAGFDDEMWTKAQDIIKGRGVASAAFLMDLGRFLKTAKRGAAGNLELQQSLNEIDSYVAECVKSKNYNGINAVLAGFKVAKAELVEGTVTPMFRMGFGMGATEQLGRNIEDAALGFKNWSSIDEGVLMAGGTQGAEFALTGAMMKTLPAIKHSSARAMQYLTRLNAERQMARPEDIMSSYIAKNHPDSVSDGKPAPNEIHDEANTAFNMRFAEFIRIRMSGGKQEDIQAWRDKNKELFGENGAKVFDDLFDNIRYASPADYTVNGLMGVKLDENSVKTFLEAGGYTVKGARKLSNGDIEVDSEIEFEKDAAGQRVFSNMKFLLHDGKLFIKNDNGIYNKSYAMDCVRELEAGRANAELQEKWKKLTDEQKDSVRNGEDVNGILGDSRWEVGGWFAGKKEIDNAEKVDNLTDVSDPKLYDGIGVFAGGQYGVTSFRHEMLGHGTIEAMRKAKVITEEDVKALKDAYGDKWEEELADDAANTAGVGDAELLKRLIGDTRGGVLAGIRRKASSFLRAIKVMKDAQGTPETFDVAKFMQSKVSEAHEVYKLHEVQRKTVELAKKQADELLAQTRDAERRARAEAEELYRQNLEERKRAGQELAVQIAKQREVLADIQGKIDDLAMSYNDIGRFDDAKSGFDAKVEELKRSTIQNLKRLGMDKGEVGKYVENTLLKQIEEARDNARQTLVAEKAELDEAIRLGKEREKAEKEAKAKRKEKERAIREAKKAKEVAERNALKEVHRKEKEAKRKQEAEAKQKQKDLSLQAYGFELLKLGLPIPDVNVTAGLNGKELSMRKEFLRKCGYYYSKELGCWVNKKNAPEAFKKAATEAVKKSVSDIIQVKNIMEENGVKPQAQGAILSILNYANGRTTEKDPSVDNPTEPSKDGKAVSERKKAEERALAEAEAAIRESGAELGWDANEIERQVKILRSNGVKQVLDKAPQVKNAVEQKPEQAEVQTKKVEDTQPLSNIKDAKAWWRYQLTPEERLGLGVVYVDGKPWNIVYCPGEIISGGENFRLSNGELPEGAEVRPFNKIAFEAAVNRIRSGYKGDKTVSGKLGGAVFDYKMKRAEKQLRKEKAEQNKARAEAEAKARVEQEALRAKDSARNKILDLYRERKGIEEAVSKEPLDLEKLGEKILAKLDIEFPFNSYFGKKEMGDTRIKAIDAEIGKLKSDFRIGDEEISGGLKNGHFCVSMKLEPETEMKLNRMVARLAKGIRKDKSLDGLVDKNLDDNALVWQLTNADPSNPSVNAAVVMLSSIGVTSSPVKRGVFLQEYPETYRSRDEYREAWEDAHKAVVDAQKGISGEKLDDVNNFRLDYFLGDDSPILKKFPFLSEIRVKYGTTAEMDGNGLKSDGLFVEPCKEYPTGCIIVRDAVPKFSTLAHEIQHAFQYFEKQGFLGYYGYKYSNWERDMSENQAEAVGERAWFDEEFRKDNPFQNSELLPRGEQTQFITDRSGRFDHEMLGLSGEDALDIARRVNEQLDGNFNVVFREGAENLVRFGGNGIDAGKFIRNHMQEFVRGPVSRAAGSILEMGFIQYGKKAIPNWLLNQVIEQKGDNYEVTLDSGVKLRAVLLGGGRGTTAKKLNEAAETGDLSNVRGEIAFEYAGDKATIPHDFVNSIIEDNIALRKARADEKGRVDAIRKALEDSGVSRLAMKRVESSGALTPSDVDVEHRTWYLSDFYPNDRILEAAYPKLYAETEVVAYGSERTVAKDGTQSPDAPLFSEGQCAALGNDGKIYVKLNPDARVKANGEVQHALVRDIGACLVKAIRRHDGLNDDVSRSPKYYGDILDGIDFLNGKVKAMKFRKDAKNFGFGKNDSILRKAMRQVIEERFEAIGKFCKSISFTQSDIDGAKKHIIEELDKAILSAFNDFYGEREAVMFANRFGKDLSKMTDLGEQMRSAYKDGVIRMDDPRYTSDEKSWSYANFYGNVLKKIDMAFGEGAHKHSDRSVVRDFESLILEYMIHKDRPSLVASPRLSRLIGYINEAALEQKTALQREGDSVDAKFKRENIDENNPAIEIERLEAERLAAIQDEEIRSNAKPKMIEACKIAIGTAKKCLASDGRTLMPNAYAKYAPEAMEKVSALVKECYPKWGERDVNRHTIELLKQSIDAARSNEDVKLMAGRFHVTGGNVEENLVATVASKIAWEKAKHRTGNIGKLADDMRGKVVAQLLQMGIPEADANILADSVISSSKVVASDIISSVDDTVTDSQIIAQAKTKAANIRIGNDIYKAFRKGYKVTSDGAQALDKARKTLEATRLKAVKRAAGFSVSEMNSMLGTDIVSDLMKIGDGGKYRTGRELAEDMKNRYFDAFRASNPNYARATNYELERNDVFRADFAATISSWLTECAKALSYGQERELAIRDAAKVKNSLPPTMAVLLDTVAHHADMLGANLGKLNVEKTLHDIEKMIDERPKFDENGNIVAGANGGKALSETTRAYQRDIQPRLQQYWKYVKKAIWFDKDKVDAEVARLQSSLAMNDTEIADIAGKRPSELEAEKIANRDLAVMQINALRRYGALKEKSAGEVMDIFTNDIAKDLAYASEKFLTERKARLDRDAAIRKDIMDGLTKPIDDGMGFDDLSKLGKWSRRFYFWSVPDMFAKLSSYFKSDSKAYMHVNDFRQKMSLAHEYQMRAASEYQKRIFEDVEDIYGESFDKFIRHACVPEAKYDRFSRAGWAIPENGGVKKLIHTGRFYTKDVPSVGAKKGDEIMREVTLAQEGSDPTRRNKHLSLSNLIYIYAACRQPDMKVNNIIFGRDAAYIADLERTIGAEGIALADRMVRNYTALRELVSPVCERVTGLAVMSPNELYVPLEFIQDKKAARTTRYELNPYPKFLMNRVYHDESTLDESTDFIGEYVRRSEDSAHYAAFAELADDVKTTFGDNKIVTQFHNLIGRDAAGALFKQLGESFNGGTVQEDSFGTAFRNFVTATTLGYNPSSCLKQLEGIGGWAVGMGPIEWAKMVTYQHVFDRDILRDALADLHQSGLFKKNRLGLWERAEGISEPMIMLMNARENGTDKALTMYQKLKESYKNHSMDLIRIFDSVASNFGAGSYYASRRRFYEVEQHLGVDDAKRLALADTDYMMQVSQQSGRPEFLHEWQRGGTGGKFLTQFVGPTLVRAGIELEAAHRHFMVERSQESFNTLASKLFAGHVICPAILTTISQITGFFFGQRDDKNKDLWDEFSTNLLISMAIGPMNGVLIYGQILDASMRRLVNIAHGNKRNSQSRFDSPTTSKLSQLADGFVKTTYDVATACSKMLDGQDVGPALVDRIVDDVIRDFSMVVPMFRIINVYPNARNYIDKLERDRKSGRR